MNDPLVTVRSFRFVAEADVCQALLESEGVRCFQSNSTVVQADWLLGNAVGYIQLQVPADQEERARELLKQIPESRSDVDDAKLDENVCLSCGAKMAENSDRCEQCGWSFDDGAEPA